MTRFVTRLFVSVSVPASVESVPVVGSVTFVAPVLVRVMELAPEVARVELSARSSVALVAVSIATPLIEVAVAAPRTGAVSDGLLEKALQNPFHLLGLLQD